MCQNVTKNSKCIKKEEKVSKMYQNVSKSIKMYQKCIKVDLWSVSHFVLLPSSVFHIYLPSLQIQYRPKIGKKEKNGQIFPSPKSWVCVDPRKRKNSRGAFQ